MSEQITITISLEQAEAIVDAANCMDLAAEEKLSDICRAYMPEGTTVSQAKDDYVRKVSELAQEVADMLRPEIDGANRRDPELQDVIHRVKMFRKYGQPDG